MRLRPFLASVALLCAVARPHPAAAQSAYVGASFIADVVRVSGSSQDASLGNGEAYGGALRAGLAIGSQWGVELEFARSGEIRTTPDVRILAEAFPPPDDVFGVPAIFPAPDISTSRQLATVATLLWWNHELNDRVGLAFLGGVAFTRAEMELRVSYPDILPPFPRVPLPMPTRLFESTSVNYGADVSVGIEGRIGMTEHLRLVPGIRLQTAADGWAIRPGIGLHWQF